MASTNTAYDQARRAAAEDARHRAMPTPRRLGLALGAVAWVAEPGLRRAGTPPVAPEPRAPMRGRDGPSAPRPSPLEDLTPPR